MSLEELGWEYRESARACRHRAMEIKQLIAEDGHSEAETMQLRQRFNLLIEMAAETSAVGTYLINYYGGKKHGNDDVRKRNGVPEPARAAQSFAGGGSDGASALRCPAGGTDAAAGTDGADVLHRAAHDAGYRGDARRESLDGEPDAEIRAGEAEALSAVYEPGVSA